MQIEARLNLDMGKRPQVPANAALALRYGSCA